MNGKEREPADVAVDYRSPAYNSAASQLESLAAHPSVPILIQGESGTGKTRWARHLHAQSPRASGPFRYIVLSTIDDALASSELFGHVAGAFTDARHRRAGLFASATGGTLFLDEIGKASIFVQGKLLHAVEYLEIRPVGSDTDVQIDARIIAATNASLSQLVEAGNFLADLYARLRVFTVRIPPLRERREDIIPLANYFVSRHARACGYFTPPEMDDELLALLIGAPWPHNLRQLDATVHRLLIEAHGARLLTPRLLRTALPSFADEFELNGRDMRVSNGELRQALEAADGNKARAARELGVSRMTIYRRLKTNGSETVQPGPCG